MTTSILNEVLLLRNEPPVKLQEYLHTINLTIFDPIFHKSSKAEEAKQKILFIITAYSEESPLLILRQDSNEEKEGICEYLQIPEYMRGPLKQLSDREVRQATTQYILQFAGPLFKALKLMDIQLEDLNLAITNREYVVVLKEDKSKGDQDGSKEVAIPLYDWTQHSKAVQQYEVLSKKKDSLEKELKNQLAYKAINELKEYKFQNEKKISVRKDGICLESSNLIKIGWHG